MNVKVHYRITQDRAGIPMDFTGARRYPADLAESLETVVKSELASDYQVPASAVEICRIEH